MFLRWLLKCFEVVVGGFRSFHVLVLRVNNLFSVTRQDRGREKNTTHHCFSSYDKSTIVRAYNPNHLSHFL